MWVLVIVVDFLRIWTLFEREKKWKKMAIQKSEVRIYIQKVDVTKFVIS